MTGRVRGSPGSRRTHMARIGMGLIGVGRHGLRYATHIARDLPDVRLVAIARRDLDAARRQAVEFGCRAVCVTIAR